MSLRIDRAQLRIEIDNDQSRKKLRELDDDMRKVRAEMRKVEKNTPEWQRLNNQLQSLTQEYDNMYNNIGLVNLSMRELRNRQRELQVILHTMSPTSPLYNQYREQLEAINARIRELRGNARETESSLARFGMSLQVFAGNMLTKAVSLAGDLVTKAKEFVNEGINMAGKAEGVVTAFNKLNAPDLLKNLRASTKGLVTDFQLMQTAVKAEKFGIPLNNLGSLLKFAQQRAQETGESIDYLVDSIINGIGRKSPLILDNLGISASRLQAQAKKTGDFASAAIKIVNEELEKQGDLAVTSGDKKTQSDVKWENAQLKVGKTLQWVGNLWNRISGNIADGISAIVGETRTANEVFDDQLEKVADLNVNTRPLIDRYEELSKKVKLTHDQTKELNPEQEELLGLIKQIQQAVPGAVTEWDKYGRAIGINTDKAREFIKTQVAMLKYMNQDAIKEAEKDLENYKSRLDALYRVKKAGTTSYNVGGSNVSSGTTITRKLTDKENALLEKEISTYESLVTGAKERLKNINGERLEERQTEMEAELKSRNRFNEMTKEQLDAWIKDTKNAKDQYIEIAKSVYNQKFGSGNTTDPKPDKSNVQRTKLNNEMKKLEEAHLKEMAELQKKYISGAFESEFDYNQAVLAQQNSFDAERKKKLQELQKSLTDPSIRIDIANQIAEIDKKTLDRQVDQANKVKKIILSSDPIAAEKEAHNNRLRELDLFDLKEKKLTEEQKKALELLEKQHAENMRKLSTREANIALKQLEVEQSETVKTLEERRISEKMSEQQYKDELLKIEIDYLNKRLRINGVSAEKIAEINKQINQATAESVSDKGKAREAALNKFDLKSLKDKKETELEVIKYYEEQGIITHDEAAKARMRIDQSYLEELTAQMGKVNEKVQMVGGNMTGAMTNFQSAEEDAISRKYDKQIKAAEGNSKKQKKLEEQKQKELNAIKAKYADKQFAVQTAMIISSTAVSAMEAYKAMAGIPVVGPALGAAAAASAVAYGASQIAVAKEQRDAAKEGYRAGGYTPKDYRDETAVGTVHANEFVATADAVRNPSVRKFLDVFDMAQKNGSIHMLNTPQILEKVRYEKSSGYQQGGYTPTTGTANNTDTAVLMTIIENNTLAMKKMNERLEEGITAYSVISGENGSYMQTKRYESMLNRGRRL